MNDALGRLRSINLNLLPILAALLRHANVTHAAAALNLTQSTVSGSLQQLRDILDDDLLVRHGRDMALTERARRLAPEVDRLLNQADRLLQQREFDPATSDDRFSIATADYVSALVALRLGPVLQADAPHITLSLRPTPGSSARDLQAGSLDLIICPNLPANWKACGITPANPEFAFEVILRDELVAIQWSAHGSAGKRMSRREYLCRPHATYVRTDGQNTIEQDTLERLGLRQRVQFEVPYFTLLPQLVTGTDLISLVPRSLTETFAEELELQVFAPPFQLPRMDLAMIWARGREQQPEQEWLRAAIRRAAAIPATGLGQPSATPMAGN
ncbi:MAG: LysR family transcriptional regulator [Burkholderiaceae bacterium]